MSDDNAVELIKRGDARFGSRQSLDSFRQELALNFAPHHASWTTEQTLSDDFASHLIDGTPLIIAGEYTGMIGSMLRPAGRQWFWHRTMDQDLNDQVDVRDYLDWRSGVMMRALYDRVTGAEGALTEADEFYGLFGDAVIAVDYANARREALSIAHYHSKDVTWEIGPDNKPDTITRKENVSARSIVARFSQPIDRVHQKIKEQAEKDGSTMFPIRHEVLPAAEYDAYVKRKPRPAKEGWVSVWIDVTNRHVMRESYTTTFRYVIPRAGRRYGFPYGISRATMIALPDSRLIQQQALAILEAAEKQVNPPLVAYSDTIRGDISMKSYGITWVDRTYDDRTGAPVTPLELAKNFKLGVESLMRTEAQLARAFKLDRMRFPDTRASKTVEEARFLIDEFVRGAVPLFSPMKSEYSDELLYEIDALVDQANGYSNREKPDVLRDQPMTFSWDNPLTDMMERQKAQKIAEVSQIGQTVAAFEAAAAQTPALQQVDTDKMFRDGALGIGTASWLLTPAKVKAKKAAAEKAMAQQQMLAAAPNIAQLVDSGVNAAQAAADIPNLSEPGMPMLPPPV